MATETILTEMSDGMTTVKIGNLAKYSYLAGDYKLGEETVSRTVEEGFKRINNWIDDAQATVDNAVNGSVINYMNTISENFTNTKANFNGIFNFINELFVVKEDGGVELVLGRDAYEEQEITGIMSFDNNIAEMEAIIKWGETAANGATKEGTISGWYYLSEDNYPQLREVRYRAKKEIIDVLYAEAEESKTKVVGTYTQFITFLTPGEQTTDDNDLQAFYNSFSKYNDTLLWAKLYLPTRFAYLAAGINIISPIDQATLIELEKRYGTGTLRHEKRGV